jgi:hypothetical protein
MPPLLPPRRPDALGWLAPESRCPGRFEELRPRLERLLGQAQEHRVYAAKRRAIYRAEDPVLGVVGIKEIRSEGYLRGAYLRWLRTHPGIREFRAGAAFQARGGVTPDLLGAAVERRGIGIDRVFLFVRWIDAAMPLGDYLEKLAPEPESWVLEAVARRLGESARLGLVHGRHSPDNLLAVPGRGAGVDVQVIDFAYAKLGRKLDAKGYLEDVARVAANAFARGLYSVPKLDEFLDLAVDVVWSDGAEVSRRRRELDAAFRRRLEIWVRRHPQARRPL